VAVGPSVITSGGGQPGADVTDCGQLRADGFPGTPDPTASIGRPSFANTVSPSVPNTVSIHPTSFPAFGTIAPSGAFGGGPCDVRDEFSQCTPGPGGNGYVLIQW
jgi:hypothetical protein